MSLLRQLLHREARRERKPVHNAPVWMWDEELETYILVNDDVGWTEGSYPEPLVRPPPRSD
jgi:hypothetical protein